MGFWLLIRHLDAEVFRGGDPDHGHTHFPICYRSPKEQNKMPFWLTGHSPELFESQGTTSALSDIYVCLNILLWLETVLVKETNQPGSQIYKE